MKKMIMVIAISIMVALGCTACGETAKNNMIVETIEGIEVENIEVEDIEVEDIEVIEITPYEMLQGVKTVMTLIVN